MRLLHVLEKYIPNHWYIYISFYARHDLLAPSCWHVRVVPTQHDIITYPLSLGHWGLRNMFDILKATLVIIFSIEIYRGPYNKTVASQGYILVARKGAWRLSHQHNDNPRAICWLLKIMAPRIEAKLALLINHIQWFRHVHVYCPDLSGNMTAVIYQWKCWFPP